MKRNVNDLYASDLDKLIIINTTSNKILPCIQFNKGGFYATEAFLQTDVKADAGQKEKET